MCPCRRQSTGLQRGLEVRERFSFVEPNELGMVQLRSFIHENDLRDAGLNRVRHGEGEVARRNGDDGRFSRCHCGIGGRHIAAGTGCAANQQGEREMLLHGSGLGLDRLFRGQTGLEKKGWPVAKCQPRSVTYAPRALSRSEAHLARLKL